MTQQQRNIAMGADILVGLVFALLTIFVLSPQSADKLEVPFKILMPVAAIALFARAFTAYTDKAL